MLKNHPGNPANQPFNIKDKHKTSKKGWWTKLGSKTPANH